MDHACVCGLGMSGPVCTCGWCVPVHRVFVLHKDLLSVKNDPLL